MKENIIQNKSFDFALSIIGLYKKLVLNQEYVLSKQLLRSGTSIGANIEEAISAQSKKDFLHKMSIAAKEARETVYWLRLLAASKLLELDYQTYLQNAEEILKILTSIVKTSSESLS